LSLKLRLQYMLTLTAELRPLNSIFHNGLRHKINSRRFSIVLPEPNVWAVAVLVDEFKPAVREARRILASVSPWPLDCPVFLANETLAHEIGRVDRLHGGTSGRKLKAIALVYDKVSVGQPCRGILIRR
jgi:hypothetical protein